MSLPEISVIIPTNRKPEVVRECLRGLAAQSFSSSRFEVLVINDGNCHDLQPLAQSFQADGLNVRVIDIPQSGPGPARNHGASAAAGPLLLFTDDDCVPEPGWIAALAEASARSPEALLGGAVHNLLTHRPASEASQLLVEFLYSHYNRDPLDARFFTSNNIAARREVFFSHGGFDPDFGLSAGEDRDLCTRWRERRGKLVYVPSARIGHAHDLTIRKFWKQHFCYGKGAAGYWEARRKAGSGSLVVESTGFYRNLLLYPLRHRSLPRAIAPTFLFILSQLANALGFFTAAGRLPAPAGKKEES